MKLPSLLRPHETFPPLALSDDELAVRLTRALEREGARRIVRHADLISFDARGMRMNVSPLASLDAGEVAVRREPTRTRIEYGVTMELATGWAAFSLCVLAALCGAFVIYGRWAPVVIAAIFYGLGLAGSYLACTAGLGAVIRRAAASPAAAREAAGGLAEAD